MSVKVFVASHKDFPMPKDDMYVPIQVGSKLAKKQLNGFIRDDDGKNISSKNPYYCELTGLYWAWQNQNKIKADYIGLVHYRRHFTTKKRPFKKIGKRISDVLSNNQAENILKKYDLILPKLRKYYIENLYDHYIHTMEAKPLDETGKIIKKHYPIYYKEFELLHKRTSAHLFNMFIMKKEIFNGYCEWLFGILSLLEKELGDEAKKYSQFQARFYGRVSELLLDVYLRTNKIDNYKEITVDDIEGVNWIKKGFGFLKAKFFKKKYDKSW